MARVYKICLTWASLCWLVSCQTISTDKIPFSSAGETFDYCYKLSRTHSQTKQILQCAQKSLTHDLTGQAEQSLASLQHTDLTQEERIGHQLLMAELDFHQHRYQPAQKRLHRLNPESLTEPLKYRWLSLQAKLSQIHHHWLKALEYTLRLPNPGNLHTQQLWRLAQLSLSEQSTNTSQKAESWRHLARIVSHFDGDIDQLDKKIHHWKKENPHHPAITLLSRSKITQATTAWPLCVDNQDPKNPLNKGIMQAFFEGKHAQQTPVLWNKPPHSPSLCGTTILSSAPTSRTKGWRIYPPL